MEMSRLKLLRLRVGLALYMLALNVAGRVPGARYARFSVPGRPSEARSPPERPQASSGACSRTAAEGDNVRELEAEEPDQQERPTSSEKVMQTYRMPLDLVYALKADAAARDSDMTAHVPLPRSEGRRDQRP